MEFCAGVMKAIAEVQTMAAAAISVRSDEGEPRRLRGRRKIANFDFPHLEELHYDRFDCGNRKIELVGPGKAEDSLENGNR